MTEPTPDVTPRRDEDPVNVEPGSGIPRWVPVAIGLLLVVMAGAAIYTGLRYRAPDTLTEQVRPRRDRGNTPAPPGEPGAGASLVYHGAEGENTPTANEAVTGEARAVISGGPGGVESVARMWARRGMVLNVLPEDAMVYVNELPIGQVRQFNTMDEVYDFATLGSYTVKVVANNGKSKTFIVTASEDAKQDVARVSAKLE